LKAVLRSYASWIFVGVLSSAGWGCPSHPSGSERPVNGPVDELSSCPVRRENGVLRAEISFSVCDLDPPQTDLHSIIVAINDNRIELGSPHVIVDDRSRHVVRVEVDGTLWRTCQIETGDALAVEVSFPLVGDNRCSAGFDPQSPWLTPRIIVTPRVVDASADGAGDYRSGESP
jgi:hypothetical protein